MVCVQCPARPSLSIVLFGNDGVRAVHPRVVDPRIKPRLTAHTPPAKKARDVLALVTQARGASAPRHECVALRPRVRTGRCSDAGLNGPDTQIRITRSVHTGRRKAAGRSRPGQPSWTGCQQAPWEPCLLRSALVLGTPGRSALLTGELGCREKICPVSTSAPTVSAGTLWCRIDVEEDGKGRSRPAGIRTSDSVKVLPRPTSLG